MFDTWRAWEEDLSITGKWGPVIENFDGHTIEWRTDSEYPGNPGKIPKENGDIIFSSVALWEDNPGGKVD